MGVAVTVGVAVVVVGVVVLPLGEAGVLVVPPGVAGAVVAFGLYFLRMFDMMLVERRGSVNWVVRLLWST